MDAAEVAIQSIGYCVNSRRHVVESRVRAKNEGNELEIGKGW